MRVTDHEEDNLFVTYLWYLFRISDYLFLIETMGILETMYTIVSTICCTFKKDKNEDIKIKIVETYINKTEGII